ncbi:hypothetical protein [Terriglobus roseus]|uniref:Uncharacterized protein n=1 Tax=Terriglobus roseus TaxID=392734 RepID=A0A1H4PKH8_9BACT|nr:hypothetical protein [Terriglobus roseus]SEC07895.1 hypothetical protein SAMN05443244_2592 [Terriglobus roseus]
MRFKHLASLTLAATLFSTPLFALQTSEQDRKDAHATAKVDEKANEEAAKQTSGKTKKAYKEQAKADHRTHQALNDDDTKKAARQQDKADRAASAAANQ